MLKVQGVAGAYFFAGNIQNMFRAVGCVGGGHTAGLSDGISCYALQGLIGHAPCVCAEQERGHPRVRHRHSMRKGGWGGCGCTRRDKLPKAGGCMEEVLVNG